MYKKFSTNYLLQQKVFDPLGPNESTPDTCGYGVRFFRLDPTLSYIEIRQHYKSGIESMIDVDDIIKPIIPHTTIDIIKFQSSCFPQHRKFALSNIVDNDIKGVMSSMRLNTNISNLVKAGIINKNSELYKQKCLESCYYPFSIILNNERIELISTTYEVLNQWVVGLNLLINNIKNLPRLREFITWENAE